jgi:DNA-binding Lrp family transcriptional regulator
MTDKQIIIDGKIKPITLEDVPTILELHKSKSFVEIAKMYGVTQNAIRYWVKKYNVKPLKQKDQIKILEEQLKRAEKTMQEIWDRLGKTLDELQAKEQECEAYKIEADEGKEINAELKAELEQEKALKETYFACYHAKHEDLAKKYDQLKAEGDLAKQLINWILKFFELTDYDWQDDQNEISALIEDYIDDKNSTIDFVNDINKGLFKKLTEIKEIAEKSCCLQPTSTCEEYENCKECSRTSDDETVKQILQKISECEVNND